MDRTKRIKNILEKNFDNFEIKILDNSNLHIGHNDFLGIGETHIAVNLINKSHIKYNRYNRLEIHKKVNTLLNDEFKTGLHSLEISIT